MTACAVSFEKKNIGNVYIGNFILICLGRISIIHFLRFFNIYLHFAWKMNTSWIVNDEMYTEKTSSFRYRHSHCRNRNFDCRSKYTKKKNSWKIKNSFPQLNFINLQLFPANFKSVHRKRIPVTATRILVVAFGIFIF